MLVQCKGLIWTGPECSVISMFKDLGIKLLQLAWTMPCPRSHARWSFWKKFGGYFILL